jgi:hypothetical protein
MRRLTEIQIKTIRMLICSAAFMALPGVAWLHAQQPAAANAETEQTQPAPRSNGTGRELLPYSLPELFKKHWVARFSVGETREKGILNSRFPDLGTPYTTNTEVGASLAYDLATKRASYLFDYHTAARHYNRFSSLDAVTHDLGLSQVANLGVNTTWTAHYRFSMTPDVGNSLIGETVAAQAVQINPVPSSGVAGVLPLGGAPSVQLSPADGLLTTRSVHMAHNGQVSLTHQFGSRLATFFSAGYNGTRFQDPNLFPSDGYSVSGGLSRVVTARTAIGLAFQGQRTDIHGNSSRTLSRGGSVVITRQIGRSSLLSLSGGPSWIESRGQQAVPLSPLLASLLGVPALRRIASHQNIGWLGSGSFQTTFHTVAMGLSYSRSISSTGGLGASSISQTGALTFSKEFRQRTAVSLGLSYGHSQLLGLTDSITLDQQGLTARLTRKVARSIDVSGFFLYARTSHGLHGPAILNHNQTGIRIVYYMHRVEAE